jgi:hypothetical protein
MVSGGVSDLARRISTATTPTATIIAITLAVNVGEWDGAAPDVCRICLASLESVLLFPFPPVSLLPISPIESVLLFPFPPVSLLPISPIPISPMPMPSSVVGDCVGETVGALVVGDCVGETVGALVVGDCVGDCVGESVADGHRVPNVFGIVGGQVDVVLQPQLFPVQPVAH